LNNWTPDDTEHVEEAIAELRKVIQDHPGSAEAHHNLAMFLLSSGQFVEGWKENRWRLELQKMKYKARHSLFPVPLWDGAPLTGRRVFAWLDQGLGDQILQATILPELIAEAAHVTVCAHPRLKTLFRRALPSAAVVTPTDAIDYTKFDCQMAVHDFGGRYRPNFEAFPKRERFLIADPLQRYSTGLTVGMAWRSVNANHGAAKSIPTDQLIPILSVPGVTFVNLQYGGGEAPAGLITDPTVNPSYDLDRFASQVAACDIVITTSNTAAHIAGALGVQTKVLLPRGPGRYWYWFADREDCPWYPSVQLIRQQNPGEWDPIIEAVSAWLTIEAEEFVPRNVKANAPSAPEMARNLTAALARIAELERVIEPLLPWSRCDDIAVDAIFFRPKTDTASIEEMRTNLKATLRETVYVDINEFKALGKVMKDRWTRGA
jgi:hypothetical protein